jgi:hypothetical protein
MRQVFLPKDKSYFDKNFLNLKIINMKNLLLALLLFISAQSFAQNNQASISFGPSLADPLNTSVKEFKTGIGAGIRGYYPISNRGSIMGNINFVSFGPKPKYTVSYALTSFKLGYRTFIGNSNFYLYADAGLVLLSAKNSVTGSRSNSTTWGFGLGGGYSLPVSKNSFIDFSPSMNYNNSYFGRKLSPELNISYRIKLHK